MRLVTVSLTEKEYDILLKICRKEKSKRHAVLKKAIREFLEKNMKEGN